MRGRKEGRDGKENGGEKCYRGMEERGKEEKGRNRKGRKVKEGGKGERKIGREKRVNGKLGREIEKRLEETDIEDKEFAIACPRVCYTSLAYALPMDLVLLVVILTVSA